MLWTIIVTLVGGLIIGLLGKLIAPGDRDNIPLWLTLLCGIGGMILGSLAYFGIFGVADGLQNDPDFGWDNTTEGVDWWRHVAQIVVAAVLVMIASGVTGKSRSKA